METLILRHDDAEAALPHQIELPAAWGVKLPDPIPFEVTLPKWCPVDADATVALHWWASLGTHLQALLPMVERQEKVRYRLDKALRHQIQVVRDIYGTSVSSALSAAASLARASVNDTGEERELGCWSMAVQVSFGLLCVRAAAKGTKDPIVAEIQTIAEWIASAFEERLGDKQAHAQLMSTFTGTLYYMSTTNALGQKLESWRGALEAAAEGAPEGVPGVAEALDVAAYEEPAAGETLVAEGRGLVAVDEDGKANPIGEVFELAEDGTRTKLGNITSIDGLAGLADVVVELSNCRIDKKFFDSATKLPTEADLAPGSDQTGVGENAGS